MWEKEHFLCRSFSPWQFNLTNMCVWHMRGRRQRRREAERLREREGLHSFPLMSVFYRAFDHCLQSVCVCVWGDHERSSYAIQNNLGTHLKKFENWHWSIINLINDFTPINLIPVHSSNMISQPRVLIFIVCGNTFQSSDRRNFNFTSDSQLRSFLINYLYSHNSLIISPIFRSTSALMMLVWSQLICSSHFLPFVSPPSASLHLSASPPSVFSLLLKCPTLFIFFIVFFYGTCISTYCSSTLNPHITLFVCLSLAFPNFFPLFLPSLSAISAFFPFVRDISFSAFSLYPFAITHYLLLVSFIHSFLFLCHTLTFHFTPSFVPDHTETIRGVWMCEDPKIKIHPFWRNTNEFSLVL